MRAVRLSPGLVQFVTDAPVPQPPEGEVLVRVLQAGICETDLQLTRGYMGFQGTLGHEFVASISRRDYSMIMGLTIFYAVLIALANVSVDLSYGLLDPRIRARARG